MVRSGGEDVSAAKVRTIFLRDNGPSHKFRDGEEFEELGFSRDEVVTGIEVNAVKEVGLFVIVWGEDNKIDYSLEDL